MPSKARKRELRELYPTYADPLLWRNERATEETDRNEWQVLRLRILKRDYFSCQYCGYRSEKYQIVHHLDENPNNNDEKNLTTICQMCNLIMHSGQGCVVQGVVDLYAVSKYNQNDIIKITREMRDEQKSDEEIVKFLRLKGRMPFKMDKPYLKKLYGFVTSRSSKTGDGMYDHWKAYHYSQLRVKEDRNLKSAHL